MLQLGINIIPVMPPNEIIALIQAAEEMGYQYCLLADEGLSTDVYVILGAAARETTSIHLAPVTNGYTRHPAVTATAVSSLHQLTNGRAFLVLVAGGSVVLDKMRIKREKPISVVRETVEICRALWSGEEINWQGEIFSLQKARLETRNQNIPIWIAARGERMLAIAGEIATGVLLMVKPDIGPALKIVTQRGANPLRVYMDRIAYTPEMVDAATHIFPYVIKDTPERQLQGFLSSMEIRQIRAAQEMGGVEAVAKLITPKMIQRYKVAGTREECTKTIAEMEIEHQLDVFILNITTAGLQQNISMLRDVKAIVTNSIK